MHTVANPFPDSKKMPTDLRGSGPAAAGAGKTYPVDPAAVERLKAHINGQKAAAPVSRRAAADVVDPEKIYPPAVIAAAKVQMAKPARGRRYGDVLTPAVLEIWHQWQRRDGKTLGWIAKNNGLIDLQPNSLSTILKKYRKERKTAQPTPAPVPTEPETAVAEPVATLAETKVDAEPGTVTKVDETAVTEAAPLPESEMGAGETAVAPFVPKKPENLPAFLDRDYAPARPLGPGDALATLAALVNDQSLRVRGSVKLNLEIEFGE